MWSIKQIRCSRENQDGKKGIKPANHHENLCKLAEDSETSCVEQETGSHIGKVLQISNETCPNNLHAKTETVGFNCAIHQGGCLTKSKNYAYSLCPDLK